MWHWGERENEERNEFLANQCSWPYSGHSYLPAPSSSIKFHFFSIKVSVLFSLSHKWLVILGLKTWFVTWEYCSERYQTFLTLLLWEGKLFVTSQDQAPCFCSRLMFCPGMSKHLFYLNSALAHGKWGEGAGRAVFTFSLLVPLREANVV